MPRHSVDGAVQNNSKPDEICSNTLRRKWCSFVYPLSRIFDDADSQWGRRGQCARVAWKLLTQCKDLGGSDKDLAFDKSTVQVCGRASAEVEFCADALNAQNDGFRAPIRIVKKKPDLGAVEVRTQR
jgi:hypothetical protein